MAQAHTVTVGPLTAGNPALYAASQAPVIGTPLTLTGTVSATPRRALVTVGADAVTTRTFTIVGVGWSGFPISEVLTIPTGSGTVQSALDYKSITSGTPGGTGWSANVSLGTNGVGSSDWVSLDAWNFSSVVRQCDANGTVNYTVENTSEDPNDPVNGPGIAGLVWVADATLASKTDTERSQTQDVPCLTRITLNSGSGSVKGTFTQIGANLPLLTAGA